MTIKLVHTENAPVEKAERTRILVMGQAARGLAARPTADQVAINCRVSPRGLLDIHGARRAILAPPVRSK